MDLDCGHCHGFCGVMLTLPAAIPGAPGTAPPSATVDEDRRCACTDPTRTPSVAAPRLIGEAGLFLLSKPVRA